MGAIASLFEDPEYEMRTYARATRMRIARLERLIQEQNARLFVARETQCDDADAALVAVLERDLGRFKDVRTRAHAVYAKIQLGLDTHTENEVLHEVRALVADLDRNRAVEECAAVSAAEIAEAKRARDAALESAFPAPPSTRPAVPPPSNPTGPEPIAHAPDLG